jgi:hypothetical protein
MKYKKLIESVLEELNESSDVQNVSKTMKDRTLVDNVIYEIISFKDRSNNELGFRIEMYPKNNQKDDRLDYLTFLDNEQTVLKFIQDNSSSSIYVIKTKSESSQYIVFEKLKDDNQNIAIYAYYPKNERINGKDSNTCYYLISKQELITGLSDLSNFEKTKDHVTMADRTRRYKSERDDQGHYNPNNKPMGWSHWS